MKTEKMTIGPAQGENCTTTRHVLFVQPAPSPYRSGLYALLRQACEVRAVHTGGVTTKRHWAEKDVDGVTQKQLRPVGIQVGTRTIVLWSMGITSDIMWADCIVVCTNAPDIIVNIAVASISRAAGKRVIALVSINEKYRFFRRDGLIWKMANILARQVVMIPTCLSHRGIGYCKSSTAIARKFKLEASYSSQYYPLAEEYGVFSEDDVQGRLESRMNAGRVRLLIIGYISRRKGVTPFIEMLRETGSLVKFELWIAGEIDPNSELGARRSEYESLGVRFFGYAGIARKKALFMDCDVLIVPSTHDSWGHVVSEAMYFGVPVFGSVGSMAVSDLVNHNFNGWKMEEEPGLEGGLIKLNDRKAISAAGRNAKRTIDIFNAECLERWQEVIHNKY